jgi:guanylate kinase
MKDHLIGNLERGLVFIVSAPAGTGKTTLVRMLTEEFKCVVESVSCTTRLPRHGEIPGKDYHFLSLEQFKERIDKLDFLEYAEVFGNMYGTSKEYVECQQRMGKHVILVIDTQGAMKLKEQGFPAIFIFVSPPSIEELRQRLLKRKTEDEQTLNQRLSWATKEMNLSSRYDYLIMNQDLDVAYQALRSIVIAEEHKTKNLHL